MTASPADSIARLAQLSAATSLVDHALGLVLGASPEAHLARVEHGLARFVSADWVLRSRMAARAAVDGGADAVHGHLRAHGGDVGARAKADVRQAYGIGRLRAARRVVSAFKRRRGAVQKAPGDDERRAAELLASFDLSDEAAIASLEDQLFWVGGHYNDDVSGAVAAAARAVLAGTASRAEAGASLMDRLEDAIGASAVPRGFQGTAEGYFEGVVSASIQQAHNFGQLSTLARAGVTEYVWHTVEDERVCPVCGHMHGKVFKVEDGLNLMARALAARTPDEVKSVLPWPTTRTLRLVSPLAGNVSESDSDALIAAGFAIPPAHLRCRCLLDVLIEGEE